MFSIPALFVDCTDLSTLRTYFYKIAIFLFLEASKPPNLQSASAGDVKPKQSAACSPRQACRTLRHRRNMQTCMFLLDMQTCMSDMTLVMS